MTVPVFDFSTLLPVVGSEISVCKLAWGYICYASENPYETDIFLDADSFLFAKQKIEVIGGYSRCF